MAINLKIDLIFIKLENRFNKPCMIIHPTFLFKKRNRTYINLTFTAERLGE